jgi:hypothetical protein
MTDSNRAAADRFADIRERIRALETEEAELRQGFIAGDLDLQGDENTVVIEVKTNERLDLKAMRQRVDEATWRPFLVSKEIAYVNVRRKTHSRRMLSPIEREIAERCVTK